MKSKYDDQKVNKFIHFHFDNIFTGKSNRDKQITEATDRLQEKYFQDPDFVTSGRRKLLHKILDGKDLLQDTQYHKSTWKLFNGSRPGKEFLNDMRAELGMSAIDLIS